MGMWSLNLLLGEGKGKTLSEWCRERILEAAEPPVPSIADFALMAEVTATQSMLIDMLSLIGRDGEGRPIPMNDRAFLVLSQEALGRILPISRSQAHSVHANARIRHPALGRRNYHGLEPIDDGENVTALRAHRAGRAARGGETLQRGRFWGSCAPKW